VNILETKDLRASNSDIKRKREIDISVTEEEGRSTLSMPLLYSSEPSSEGRPSLVRLQVQIENSFGNNFTDTHIKMFCYLQGIP
jgi:leucyl aminopeptidase